MTDLQAIPAHRDGSRLRQKEGGHAARTNRHLPACGPEAHCRPGWWMLTWIAGLFSRYLLCRTTWAAAWCPVLVILPGLLFSGNAPATGLIVNVDHRSVVSLNGPWHIIVDPYENGYYDYRYEPLRDGYFKNARPGSKSDRVEYSFADSPVLHVPGDWNSQDEKLFWYEGTIWYQKSFDYRAVPGKRQFLYFGAVNYRATVYINGDYAGEHEGGFTPFNVEVTGRLREKDNSVVVKADNRRFREAVPTVNTDWFNYGGITRQVLLLEVPDTFVRDYAVRLDRGRADRIAGWIQLDGAEKQQAVRLTIPELGVHRTLHTDSSGAVSFAFAAAPDLWSPENPKLYDVLLMTGTDTLADRIGFRNIAVKGREILLNGRPVFLRGISMHEEAPFEGGSRAWAPEHARVLLGWARELHCNFVRLAHYPHNEAVVRAADETGIMLWSEIPVYWTILWENESTFQCAQTQLSEMIARDRNRASVILWSVANETPVIQPRLAFLKKLIQYARKQDPTRLITAAMERHYTDRTTQMIDDPLGAIVDVLGCNEYLGWYDGLPAKCDSITWQTVYNKPLIISEFGGGALYGYHGSPDTRWTEEFQEAVYVKNLSMLARIPWLRGMTPWILKDFRSPRRPLPDIQDYWNRKGLVSDEGQRKQAFRVLKAFYHQMDPRTDAGTAVPEGE